VSDDEGDLPDHQRGSFGRPAPGLEGRVVDPETGRPSGLREVGELWLRGPFLMDGYYGRERADTFTSDGWYRTGDLVEVDADGLYYFKGRHGDMIKTGGANVSPREVEAAITEVTGFGAHVLGVDRQGRGQVVAAAVVLPVDRALDPVQLEQLRQQLRGRLSAYKVPTILITLPEAEVPTMSSGKLDRRALLARLADG